MSDHGWWIHMLTSIETSKRSTDFLDKFNGHSSSTATHSRNVGETLSASYKIYNTDFKTLDGLKSICVNEFDKLVHHRKRLLDSLKLFAGTLSQKVILDSSTCHLHNSFTNFDKSKKCDLCKSDVLFNTYAKHLFSKTDEILRATQDEQTGDEHENSEDLSLSIQHKLKCSSSELEKFFKFIISYCKNDESLQKHLKTGKECIGVYNLFKEEFRVCRQFWMASSNQISGVDELSMAKIRLRVRDKNDPADIRGIPYIIEENTFRFDTESAFQNEKIEYHKNELRMKLGQLLYLQNLLKVNEFRRQNTPYVA
jgi:hypothetical protein